MMAASAPQFSSKTQKHGVPDFDRLASAYRWMEYLSFGPALRRCRAEFLAELKHCRNALLIGDGDGRFTSRLLETNLSIRVDAIDASPAMLEVLARRAGRNAERVRTEVADARVWVPKSTEAYDLVVTHFFLDCLTTDEIRSLAGRIRSASISNALWVVSDFAVPRSLFGQIVARPLVAALYQAFGLLTGLKIRSLPNHPSALGDAGFRLLRRRRRLWGLLLSEIWASDINN